MEGEGGSLGQLYWLDPSVAYDYAVVPYSSDAFVGLYRMLFGMSYFLFCELGTTSSFGVKHQTCRTMLGTTIKHVQL